MKGAHKVRYIVCIFSTTIDKKLDLKKKIMKYVFRCYLEVSMWNSFTLVSKLDSFNEG